MDDDKKNMRGERDLRWLMEMCKEKDKELESVLSHAADGVGKFACDPSLTILYYNKGLATLVGTTRGKIEKEGFNSSLYVHPDDLAYVQESMAKSVASGQTFNMRYRLRHLSGRDVWVKTTGFFTKEFYQGIYPVIYLIFTDITELVTLNEKLAWANTQLELEANRYKVFAELVNESFFEYDIDTGQMVLFGGKRGGDQAEIAPPTRQNVDIFLAEFAQRRDFEDIELQLHATDGTLTWHAVRAGNIEKSNGRSLRIIGTIKNIQALKDAEACRENKERQLLMQSRCDPMTQLLNRSAMQQALEDQINSQAAYMFSIIDIDDFKSINDNHGHVFGDEVLKYVADILRNACRSNDITGRLGGDEFVMLFRADFTREEADRRLISIIRRIREGVDTLSIEARVSVSIGAILVTRPGLSFLDVYRSADAALYEAKHKGKKTYSLSVY